MENSLTRQEHQKWKWKAYRFSIHDISGGKADSLWPQDRTFTCEAAIFSFSSRSALLSRRCHAENHISILRMMSRASAELLSSVPTALTGKGTLKATFWKRERFRDNEFLHGAHFWRFFLTEKTVRFSFLSARALPSHRCPQTLLQHRVSGLHHPAVIPCRANIDASPRKGRDNSHPCTRQASY